MGSASNEDLGQAITGQAIDGIEEAALLRSVTIGFTKKSAEEFFGLHTRAGIRHLVDIRLHNSSQLAGFTKQVDLDFFLGEICRASYQYEPLLAPTEKILHAYRQDNDWEAYEPPFRALLDEKRAERPLPL